MKIKFRKYHGAGNDFIIPDSIIKNKLPRDKIAHLCSRKHGIGADGLIIIGEPQNDLCSFKFFNSDGQEADFCGNGLRCAALHCYLKFGIKTTNFHTNSGICKTRIISQKKITLEAPVTEKPKKINIGNISVFYCSIGVPHVVKIVKDLAKTDVKRMGKSIRFSKYLEPNGANANFAQIISKDFILLRTYERGVEDETEACGSGACATALSLAIFAKLQFPIKIKTISGDVLEVSLPKNKEKTNTDKLLLCGPAEFTFSGEIDI